MLWLALKYATYACTARCASWNRPGTRPVMSEALAIVMVLSVMPVPFFSPVQFPGVTVGPPVSVNGTTAPDWVLTSLVSGAQAASESVTEHATATTRNRLRAELALISAVLLVEDWFRAHSW